MWDWARGRWQFTGGRAILPFLRDQPGGDAAAASFDFLRNSAAAIDVVRGDGRLMLEREPPHSFDILVLDAFSDDAIPVHLLTRQALAMYFDRLRAGGLLLIHLTNRYLDLSSEVEALAAAGQRAVLLSTAARSVARHRVCELGGCGGEPGGAGSPWRRTRVRLRSGKFARGRTSTAV